jgi:putative peptidoglycan lipid II flippase
MWPLQQAGLTLATSIGACVNAALLFWFLRRHGFYAPRPGWFAFLCRLVVALGCLVAVLYFLAGPAQSWLEAGLWTKLARLFGVIVAGAVAYFGALYLLGFRIRDFNRREAY